MKLINRLLSWAVCDIVGSIPTVFGELSGSDTDSSNSDSGDNGIENKSGANNSPKKDKKDKKESTSKRVGKKDHNDKNKAKTSEIGDQSVVHRDRSVLEALFQATNGSQWRSSHGWLSPQPLSDWLGVTVDEGGSVTRLDLGTNNLEGG